MTIENKKRILFVYPEGFPNLRISKIISMLESQDSEIYFLSDGATKFRKFRNKVVFNERSIVWHEGITAKIIRKSKSVLYKNKVNLVNQISDDFAEILEQIQPDVIHWGGLAKSLSAARVATSLKIHFILDLHENYPYNYWSTARDLDSESKLYSLSDWLLYEKLALSAADSILVTCDEMRSRLIGMHGFNSTKIFVVHNTENPQDWDEIDFELTQRARLEKSTFDLIYGGSCSIHRGLDVAIKGIALLISDYPDIRLHIVGDGPGINYWKNLTNELSLSKVVQFHGQLPYPRLRQMMLESNVGIIPHHQYGQTDNTNPHKLYQHFGSGLPSLVSSCHSLQNAIVETGTGMTFIAGDSRDFAESLIILRKLFIPQTDTPKRGHSALKDGKYSWKYSQSQLRNAYVDEKTYSV
jgi:glycosyltransferase involved in cell wall biosynthesis